MPLVDRYHHGNLKAALLKAAFQLIQKIGLEGFTLREVARRAGVSHNAPYRHFKTKEDLIAALAAEGFSRLHAVLGEAAGAPDAADPDQRLKAASRAYLKFGLANPARFQVMFHSNFDREHYEDYVASYRRAQSVLAELMIGCRMSGRSVTESSGEILWASVHGITELGIAQRLEDGIPAKLEALVDAAVDILLAGMSGGVPPAA